MLVQLPTPYPDELLYSVIARYARYHALAFKRVQVALFGRVEPPRVALPMSLGELATRTAATWGRSADEIAIELTLFPYYGCWAGAKRSGNCLELMRSGRGSAFRSIGATTPSSMPRHDLMFCPECRSIDLSTYRETYWRRCHQLPGVLVCAEHECHLARGESRTQAHRYFDATDHTHTVASSRLRASEPDTLALIAIARRSRDILHGNPPDWVGDDFHFAYSTRLADAGFSGAKSRDVIADIGSAFEKYVGEAPLRYFLRGVEDKGHWIREILGRRKEKTCHPLRHILFQLFLETFPSTPSRDVRFAAGPWKCPNKYFQHEDLFPIKGALSKARRDGVRSVSARCSCGMRFTFSRCDESDPRLPVIRTVRSFAPTWAGEINRMKASGISVLVICKQMKLPFNAVKHLSKEEVSQDWLRERQADLRKRWSKCLMEAPNRSWAYAHSKNRSLYRDLKTFDRKWIESNRPMRGRPACLTKNEWRLRDNEYSKLLRNTVRALRKDMVGGSLSANRIISAANLKPWLYRKLDCLPKCRRLLAPILRSRRRKM
ncbi:TnsD family Tn7-like transposition protein [Microvirga soli]|uniref:TnsD family Tn7-like transposition protein n=1 Tax=Microvirga soli TaxID=1854496 RepID=UPI00191FB643